VRDRIANVLGPEAVEEIELWNDAICGLEPTHIVLDEVEELNQAAVLADIVEGDMPGLILYVSR
jgi:hypothetical protein